ncbi:hypothetical protein FOA52_006646, partial [Chlamydomonas sp. UWO 241]
MEDSMEDFPPRMMSHSEAEQARKAEVEGIRASLGVQIRPSRWEYAGAHPGQREEPSPSVLDGLDPVKQDRWRREFLHLIYKAGTTLKIPPWGLATAALLCHRFFARKSMKRNDRFVIAAASLHLAAKIQEAPKPIREIVRECERVRHARDENLQRMLAGDPAQAEKAREYIESAKEQILMAERALLYTLGFDL